MKKRVEAKAASLVDTIEPSGSVIGLVQFAHVAKVCRESASAADAAKRLFAVSRKAKKSNNDSDRLAKYLARFGLKFKDLLVK